MRTIADPYSRLLCLRIIPSYGGNPIYLTQYPHPLRMDTDKVYSSNTGIEFSDFELSVGFTPAVVELSGSTFEGGISRERLLRGELDGSRMYLFATSWADPVEDEEQLGTFILGKADIEDTSFKIECTHIIDSFNMDVSVKYTKDCTNTFCDHTADGKPIPFSVCKLVIEDWEISGEIISVNQSEKTITVGPEATTHYDDWFVPGYIQFEVTNFIDETVWTPPFAVVASVGIGDTPVTAEIRLLEWPLYEITEGMIYRMRPDCIKTLETCRDKYNNLLPVGGGGFLGFPHPPTTSYA